MPQGASRHTRLRELTDTKTRVSDTHAGCIPSFWHRPTPAGLAARRSSRTSHFFGTDDYERGFTLGDDETLADILSRYDEVATETEKIVTDLPDLGAPLTPTPEGIPWLPAGLVYSPRWVLLHLIEETARHAGHADILREQYDGATGR